jgi:hypothetical protein
MIGETLTLLLDSTAILLQKGASLTEENILGALLGAALGALPGLLCTVPGVVCGLPGALCALPGWLCCLPTCGLSLCLCSVPGGLCAVPGGLCILPGWLCSGGGCTTMCLYGFFGGQEIMTGLSAPFSKFIEPFRSCSFIEPFLSCSSSLFESCPIL